jgi:hypothetical protein
VYVGQWNERDTTSMLYRLESRVTDVYRTEIEENRTTILRHFIRDIEEDAFLTSGPINFMAKPSSGYTVENLKETDFLYSDLSLIVVSPRAYDALHSEIMDDMLFYSCLVTCGTETLPFYAGKITTKRAIVDTEKSTYRTIKSKDGDIQTLAGTVYRDDLEEDFFFARDVGRNYRYAGSDKFVELVRKNDLRIDFTPHPTALLARP